MQIDEATGAPSDNPLAVRARCLTVCSTGTDGRLGSRKMARGVGGLDSGREVSLNFGTAIAYNTTDRQKSQETMKAGASSISIFAGWRTTAKVSRDRRCAGNKACLADARVR